MLDAVTAALDKEKEASPASDPEKVVAAAEAAKTEPAKALEDEADLAPDELARLNAKTRKRIDTFIEQRREARTRISELEPKAKQYDVIVDQIRATGLDQGDLNAIFEIGTQLKQGNLFEARKLLEPIWDQVNERTGGKMPADLIAEIAEGKLAAERAQELAVARAAAQVGQYRQQADVQRQAQERTEAAVRSVVESVNAWARQKAAIDPDWKLKSSEIRDALKLSLLEGNRPQSAQEAVQMAEKALEAVNARLRAYRPAPKAIRTPIGGSGASTRSNPAEPKSMLEAITAAL